MALQSSSRSGTGRPSKDAAIRTSGTTDMLRVLFPLLILLCTLQVFSIKTSVPTEFAIEMDRALRDTWFGRSSSETNNNNISSFKLKDLGSVLSDPVVAQAVKQAVSDYYQRVKTSSIDVNGITTTSAASGKGNIRGGSQKTESLENHNDEKYDDDETSVQYYQTHPLFKQEQERIDTIPTMKLCQSYGVEPLSQNQLDNLHHHPDDDKNNERGRRVFFGSLIANESWEMIEAHAIEVQDLYHVVAFVEANTTQNRSPRQLKYGPRSLKRKQIQQSGLFGNTTKVLMDQWLFDWPDLRELDREVEQRNTVVDLWIKAGMTRDDVGIVADIDEIVSRDFLRALRVCDFPKLRRQDDEVNNPPSCKLPKMVLSAISFEATPLCIKEREWFHPDVILGQCLEGIGDPTGRVVPEREHKRQYGRRTKSWGRYSLEHYPPEVLNSSTGLFPLFSGRDIRTVLGSTDPLTNYAERPGHGADAVWGAAFHLHNWFVGFDMEVVRHKYLTYGHPNRKAEDHPLNTLDEDVDILVRCIHGLGNDISPKSWTKYYHIPPESNRTLGGNRPIYFLNTTYVEERHRHVTEMIRRDEVKYGPSYNSSGPIYT